MHRHELARLNSQVALIFFFFFISNVVEVDEIVLFVIVNRSCQCLGWESVVFVTVNWAGQWWGGKVLCLLSAVNLTVFRVGKVCEELSEAETD